MSSQHLSFALDLFTVKVMAIVTVTAVSLAALLAWRVNRQVAGLGLFAFGLMSLTTGALIGLARVVIPGDAMVIGCNVFMLAGMIAVSQGIRVFRGFRVIPAGVVALFSGVAAVLFFYWLFGHVSFGRRVGVISCAYALLAIDASASMFRNVSRRDRTIYWPTGVAFAFAATYLAARAVAGFSGLYGDGLLAPVPVDLVFTICANVAYIACVAGMLLASNTQLRHDARKLALFDPLTNLPNRRFILDRMLDAERSSMAAGHRFGIIYLDLDDFKEINDTLGHAAGDELLRNVSAAMAGTLRAGDCLGRIGGDEFVVLAEHVEEASGVKVLAQRLKAIAESVPVPGDPTQRIQISCGSAIFPDDGANANEVMRVADHAMYRAKRLRGRNERLAVAM